MPPPHFASAADTALPHRRSGRSGLHLPLLTLGLRPSPDFPSLLRHALQSGITAFDATPRHTSYGSPTEGEIGRALGVWRAERPDLVISARIGLATGPGPLDGFGSRKHILSTLDRVLRRIGLDHLDILYAHRYDPTTPLEETMGALASAVHQGKALYTGISGYAPAPAGQAAGLLRGLGAPAVACQASYSLLNRWVEEGLLDILDEHGIGCIACAPFHHGDLPRLAPLWPSPLDARSPRGHGDELSDLAAARGQSIAQLALSWTLRDPRITSALLTTSCPAHLLESSHATRNLTFTPAELIALDACCPPDA
ncbi:MULTISPECIES: aldo/keto reductase [Streptomyces]|uniref:NADP-dependent oxidoreductase domain-containing protein n=1 Tax=Streptomyces kasugaensis TaxID=1946 RepID=A0A4Q9I255_STRKA|nr:aldo/keto reductase [Streptomyces kasugaensis]TBO60740.1 hypothetical protein EYS09_05045 [Streptomyces kasugaensis]